MIHDSSVGNADHEASDCTEVAVRHPKINDLSDSRATLRRRGPTAFVEPMIPSELLPAALRKLEPPQATPGRCQAAQNGIDLAQEDLISPLEATRHYPSGPMGRKAHVSRVYRDMTRGFRGIVLESIRTPKLATSRQAIARFFRHLTEAGRRDNPAPSAAPRRSPDPRVERELDRLKI